MQGRSTASSSTGMQTPSFPPPPPCRTPRPFPAAAVGPIFGKICTRLTPFFFCKPRILSDPTPPALPARPVGHGSRVRELSVKTELLPLDIDPDKLRGFKYV